MKENRMDKFNIDIAIFVVLALLMDIWGVQKLSNIFWVIALILSLVSLLCSLKSIIKESEKNKKVTEENKK